MDKTRMQQYMSQMRAMFNKHALYSDESPQYQIPFEPNPGDTVKIRFRTLKNNVDAVYFISGSTRAQMQVGLVRNGFDYYEIEIPVGNEPIRYFFEIQAGRVVCYYNKLGVTRELQEMYSFGIIPDFHTPDWAKGAVMYQIFVDRFCNGDPSNDVLTGEYSYIGEQVNKVDDWNRFPEQMDVRNFYGVMSGTSMATPVVTGVVALWLQANPMLTPEQIKEIISETSIRDTYTGGTD